MAMKSKLWKLTKSIALPVIGGGLIGRFATKTAPKQYDKLKQPDFAPPGWVFPVAWTTLYTMMGTAKHLYDENKDQDKSVTKSINYGELTYDIQLGLNFLWSFLFFKWNLRGTAFIDAALLLTSVTLTAYFFYKESKTAGALMVPYVGWAAFALGLNYSVWQLNK